MQSHVHTCACVRARMICVGGNDMYSIGSSWDVHPQLSGLALSALPPAVRLSVGRFSDDSESSSSAWDKPHPRRLVASSSRCLTLSKTKLDCEANI